MSGLFVEIKKEKLEKLHQIISNHTKKRKFKKRQMLKRNPITLVIK